MNNVKQMGLLVMLLLAGWLLTACARAEPTIPPRHEMPPLETAVTDQTFQPITYSLLEPTDLGDGWRGAACPTVQPLFCLYKDDYEQAAATLALEIFPLARSQLVQQLLMAEGLTAAQMAQPGTANYEELAHMLLTNLAETSLANVAAAEDQTVVALPWEPVSFGTLPGLAVGHQVLAESGEVLAHVRYFIALDGNGLYWLALNSRQMPVPADMETAAAALLAHLRLPLVVLPTDVEQVRVEMMISLTAVLGEGFIQHSYSGDLLTVRGISEDGNWWLVECPGQSAAIDCWAPNYTGRVRPR